MKNKTNKNFLFHPILFGLYPVLALYVFNRNEILFSATQQAIITSFIITLSVMAVFLLIFRSWQKAAIPSSLTLLLFFSYGHVFDLLKSVNLFGELIGRHRFLIPVWLLLFIAGQILLARSKKITILNAVLNSVSLFLMFFLSVQILSFFIQSGSVERNISQENVAGQAGSLSGLANRDVYYILVDAYSRQDLLQNEVNLDTSNFISELKNLGFYIPNCAQSNYDNTLLSISSTLNMDYLEALGIDYRADKVKYRSYIQKNLVMEQFKEMGYSTATFKSLYPVLDLQNVTYYYDYFKDVSVLDSQASLNFQYLFLRTTFMRPLMELIESNQDITVPAFWGMWIPANNTLNGRDYRQYQQNVFALDTLQKIPSLPGKKFVYAHLYVTHQPYVFYPDGRFHPFLVQDARAYRDQVAFANARLLEIVRTILAESNPAPIIVIQGDHSYFKSADRLKILNAYYFPDGGDKNLYATVTPVNTFRLIFNTYFGEQNHLLPDISRYVDSKKNLQEVPFTCTHANP